MSTTNLRPQPAANATMHGTVVYRLPAVGAFTLGLCLSLHDDVDDERRMHVGFGRWEQPGLPDPASEHPVLFGIPLRGWCAFDVDQADEHLLREPRLRTGLWLNAQRADRGHGWHPAPAGTRAKAAGIVAELVSDFRAREDYPELLAHHRHTLAPDRARLCRERVARLRADIARLNRALHTEQQLLARQLAHRP